MKLIKSIIQITSAILLAVTLVGCASGPKYSALHATEPPIAAGNGRIYMYRTTAFGAAVQPTVWLNDQDVGSAKPKGYFYVDRPAGDCKVTTTTEVRRSLSLTLDPGQQRYVRLNMAWGFFVGHVWPELIENDKAEKDIKDCHYMGK